MKASALLAIFLSLTGPAALGQSLPVNELMTAVFKDAYDPARKAAYVPMARDGKRGHYLVQAKGAARLPSGTVVLALSGVPAQAPDKPQVSQTAGGLLSVCFLSGKSLLTCRENVAELGSNGEFGDVHFISLGQDKPALAVIHGVASQGATVEHLAVFALEDNTVHNLTRTPIKLSSVNPQGGWSIQGQWRLDRSGDGSSAYRAIELGFTGQFAKGPRPGRGAKGATARYEVVAGQYTLVKGRNPVPPI